MSRNPDRIAVEFSYQPLTGGKHKVSVAGDFNNWDPDATPMREENGVYFTRLELRKGRYEYKFVVDGQWVTDEHATEFSGDRFGGQNAVVYAGNPEEIEALRKVEFRYEPRIPVKSVFIAGTMNAWNPTRDRLVDLGDGSWGIVLLLKADVYAYKFVVDGQHWVMDPANPIFENDGFDGRNSLIEVDDSYPVFSRILEDGMILTHNLPTEQSLRTLNPLDEHRIEFRTQAYHNDVEKIELWLEGDRYAMTRFLEDGTFDYYSVIIERKEKSSFQYCFVYTDAGVEYFLLEGQFSRALNHKRLFRFDADIHKPFETPDWVKEGVIYQIFVDRFYNGAPRLNQDFKEWYYDGKRTPPPKGKKLKTGQEYYHLCGDWYDTAPLRANPYHPEKLPDWNIFYGGDLVGVRKKLGYLARLGVTILYFNPIFEARSNHKYDAADYMKVDPHFGSEKDMRKLVQEAHDKGMRIILDIALNHTGDTFAAFQDTVKKGPDSPYWLWYEWKKWPLPEDNAYRPKDYYACWWGFGNMPDLNYDLSRPTPHENGVRNLHEAVPNEEVVGYMMKMVDYWIGELDLDGFRLDVPNEVPFWFWEIFRAKVKKTKRDAWIVGELWANAEEWVNARYCDSVMNYAYFRDPVHRFFNMRKCSARKFDRDLKPGLVTYPRQATQCMMNLLDSHDTYRFLEAADGDVHRLKLAVAFQMTFIGTPHIWYGDEVGMRGGHDPDCRRPFYWKYREDAWRRDLRSFYRKMIEIRKSNDCLIHGDFITLYVKDRVYAYMRRFRQKYLVIIINNEKERYPIEFDLPGSVYRDLLSKNEYRVDNGTFGCKLKPMTALILSPV